MVDLGDERRVPPHFEDGAFTSATEFGSKLDGLPPVRENVITTRRPGAQLTLLVQGRGSRQDPGLAQWQYGLGRVAACAP